MSPNLRILVGILAFVALTLGTFIWFIATWDPSNEEPVMRLSPANPEERLA